MSLKARAIAILAQREHSRIELQRKLLRIAKEQLRMQRPSDALDVAADPEGLHEVDSKELEAEQLEAVRLLLDWLESHGYLSESRFIESRIHARTARFGNLRIQQELSQHGLAPDAASKQALKESELERARKVRQRKFTEPPQDASEKARQVRFLAGRGFSAEVIRKLLRSADED